MSISTFMEIRRFARNLLGATNRAARGGGHTLRRACAYTPSEMMTAQDLISLWIKNNETETRRKNRLYQALKFEFGK
jgi:hypothetical protein